MSTGVGDVTSSAVAVLLADSVRHESELDTTITNVVLDDDALEMLDVGFSDVDSDGKLTHCIYQ